MQLQFFQFFLVLAIVLLTVEARALRPSLALVTRNDVRSSRFALRDPKHGEDRHNDDDRDCSSKPTVSATDSHCDRDETETGDPDRSPSATESGDPDRSPSVTELGDPDRSSLATESADPDRLPSAIESSDFGRSPSATESGDPDRPAFTTEAGDPDHSPFRTERNGPDRSSSTTAVESGDPDRSLSAGATESGDPDHAFPTITASVVGSKSEDRSLSTPDLDSTRDTSGLGGVTTIFSRPSSPISAFPTTAASGVPSEAINTGSTNSAPLFFIGLAVLAQFIGL